MEGMPDHSSESVLLSGVRSALCAPILLRGRAVGCFYVTHRQVAGLFGPDEERLADFIATLAGAALENAEGFAELHRLNETLEIQYTESQQAEKRIQEQAALLDKARDAISVHDLDGRILYWNQSSERLYGWPAAEVLGKSNEDLLYRGPSFQLAEAQRQVLERGEWSGELCQTTKEGKEITVESRWTLVRDAVGEPKSKLVVNTDVTEKKRLESQFLRAQRMESIGTLAGGIAHDINNLLLPIMLSVDLLKQDLEENERLTLLDDLERSAQRGADMVKQILSFARGIGGHRVLVQLKHVVSDMAKMVTRTFPKSIQFEADLANDLWVVNGDPTQLYQMLMNLCVNARDAMPRGGSLSVNAANVLVAHEEAARLHPDAKAGPYVRVTVADNGMGMPASLLDKIFDPFFTTKEFGKGTGIGLSTVLGIVKGHGGFLHVNSTHGAGTEFVIFLPAVDPALGRRSDPQIDLLPVGHGETILVVDDEVAICRFTQRNLEAHGYRVLTAQNGLEAVYVFERNGGHVELLLTDMMMPGMDGAATIKALKKLQPKLRVIAASGMPDVAESAAAECQAFLTKPFRVDRLLHVVHDVLHQPSI
jgi:PAS domain S-box-containing protein